MCRISLAIVFFILYFFQGFSQFSFDTIFSAHPLLKKISGQANKYRLQIIYTEIDEASGKAVFTDHFFNVKPANYFYCASLVKLPVSILGLQKMNEIGIDAGAIMYTDSTITCHRTVKRDTTSPDGYPSIEHYIKKMFLVSDNEAYGRVYEFLGVDYIHTSLEKRGYPEIRITSRYDGDCKGKDNLVTNPVTFLSKDLKILHSQKEQVSSGVKPWPAGNLNVGRAYIEGRKKVNRPRNFSGSNYLNLSDCHSILRELLFDQGKKFGISDDQQKFLVRYLTYSPRESLSPHYDPKDYPDNYKKYLFYGDLKGPIDNPDLFITNIVGQSYGFMSDCAYFFDKKNNIKFMLSAVIYATEDEVLNDGKYDYKTVALPYLGELGRQFYRYELQKKKNEKK